MTYRSVSLLAFAQITFFFYNDYFTALFYAVINTTLCDYFLSLSAQKHVHNAPCNHDTHA